MRILYKSNNDIDLEVVDTLKKLGSYQIKFLLNYSFEFNTITVIDVQTHKTIFFLTSNYKFGDLLLSLEDQVPVYVYEILIVLKKLWGYSFQFISEEFIYIDNNNCLPPESLILALSNVFGENYKDYVFYIKKAESVSKETILKDSSLEFLYVENNPNFFVLEISKKSSCTEKIFFNDLNYVELFITEKERVYV